MNPLFFKILISQNIYKKNIKSVTIKKINFNDQKVKKKILRINKRQEGILERKEVDAESLNAVVQF